MSVVESELRVAPKNPAVDASKRLRLSQPKPRVAPTQLVKLCYTLVHAAEAVGIRDLADGEYLPSDKTLEEGIERQLNYLLDQVGCNRPGFRLLEIGCGYGHLLRLAKARGAEPDECYTIGPKAKDAPPQIAIEVVVSNPLLDKLDVYAGLGVAEVWIWHSPSRNIAVHRLRGGKYEVVVASELLRGLDLGLLASFVKSGENHTALVKSYRAALRG